MTYIALLRAVNLGGRNMVAMAALRELVVSLGFGDVRTLLQSGNLVFRERTPLRRSGKHQGTPLRRSGKHQGTPLRRSGKQGPRRSASAMERALQTATAEKLGVTTEFLVRTADEWKALIAANPFPREAGRQPNRLLLMALRDEPTPAAVAELQAAITGPESVRVVGRHAYVVYPEGIGTSRVTNALIEKKLSTRATGRNWNTVLKLAALAGE